MSDPPKIKCVYDECRVGMACSLTGVCLAPEVERKLVGPHAEETSKFKPGDRVVYIPTHANGDSSHPDCERGVVSTTNAAFVFVLYGRDTHTKATSPRDLRLEQ